MTATTLSPRKTRDHRRSFRLNGYLIVVHGFRKGGWRAQVKEMPGCIAVESSRSDLTSNMAKAIEGYEEALETLADRRSS